MVGILELRRHLFVAQGLPIAPLGRVRRPIYRCGVEARGVFEGRRDRGLQLLVAHVGGVAEGAIRAGNVLADLGSLLGRHTTPRAKEDKSEAEDKEEHAPEERHPRRQGPLASGSPGRATYGASGGAAPGASPVGPPLANRRSGPVGSALYGLPPSTE